MAETLNLNNEQPANSDGFEQLSDLKNQFDPQKAEANKQEALQEDTRIEDVNKAHEMAKAGNGMRSLAAEWRQDAKHWHKLSERLNSTIGKDMTNQLLSDAKLADSIANSTEESAGRSYDINKRIEKMEKEPREGSKNPEK